MHSGALLRLIATAAAIQVSLAATADSAPIGEAASVVPAANFIRNGAPEKQLAIRDTLEQNDRILTTGAGSTRVRFLDDTMLTIGPNSEVLLDQFVFDGNKAQKATVEVVRGAMRFVSGTSDRRAYEIKTPAATIGVRGTVVDIGFVNGRWSYNTVDGTITATLTATGETRSFTAGQQGGFTIGPSGFTPLNSNDASQLWRRLDGAHQQLAKAAGSSPSAPQGAAAGGRGGGDVTGAVPGSQSQVESRIGEIRQRIEQNGGITTLPPVILNIISSTGSTNPISTAVFADLNAMMTASTVALGPTGPGPAFTFDPLSVHAIGGDQSEIPVSPVGERLNRLFLDSSTTRWDGNANKAFRGGVFSGTNPVANDVNAVAIGRITATVSELQTVLEFGEAGDPIYQIGRWTNGVVGYSQNGGVSGLMLMNQNQGLHYIIFGHTNGLYDSYNQFQIAQTVTYQLENATKPTWNTNNGTSAPGTFSGTLAVAFGTLAVSYGLQAQVVMDEGTISFQTTGGVTNPHQSGAIGSALGGVNKRATAFASATSPGGGACATCFALIDFVPVARDKVGVNYLIEVNLPGIIEGAAVFGSPGTPVASAAGGRPLAAVVDVTGAIYANAATDGIAEISGSNVLINSISDQTYTRTRGTATSALDDTGTFKSIGWERWTEGTYTDQNLTEHSIPQYGGLHIIHGTPSTIPTGLLTAAKVQYSLVGGTSPTISDGSVAPGTLGANSKIGIDFSTQKIGLDLFVTLDGILYNAKTAGGAAALTDPSASQIGFDSNGIISGVNIQVFTSAGTGACTSGGNCLADVKGFLSGFEAAQAGIVYSMKDQLSTGPYINGAAAFSRDFPQSNVGAFAYADPTVYGSVPLTVGPAQDFNSSSQGIIDQSVVPDNAKTSGLSVQSFNLEINADTGVFGWHRLDRGAASGYSVDQGVIANVLGWERLTGTLHKHTSNGGGPDMVLSANQGVHIIHGVAATNIPTNVTYTYNYTGGTSPTLADGSSAPGAMLNTSKVGVNFSNTAPKFGVDLKVDMQTAGGNGQYNILSAGGATSPSLPASSLHSNGTFNAANIPTTLTTGTNTVCASGCTAAVSGFLAGDGAKNLGIIYQFGNSSTPGKAVTGAAGFTKQVN